MFANFALPDLARVSRRTVLGGLVFGLIGLIACLALGAPLTGLGLCVGLALGLFNFRLIQRSVIKVGAREDENHKRPLAANTVARLAVISALALGLLFLSFDLGLGVMVGLAAFQFLLLLNVARSMFKMGHDGLSGDDAEVIPT
jgi:O-antigen/teichoic acid export membrane protein